MSKRSYNLSPDPNPDPNPIAGREQAHPNPHPNPNPNPNQVKVVKVEHKVKILDVQQACAFVGVAMIRTASRRSGCLGIYQATPWLDT